MSDKVLDRFYVELNKNNEDQVKTILHQSSILWNCLVHHLGDAALEIARCKGDKKEIEEFLTNFLTMGYRFLILGEDVGVRFKITDEWRSRIRFIRRLPRAVQMNRVNDLIQAYMHVYLKHSQNEEYPYVPSIKSIGSTETIRFSGNDWHFEGQKVTLKVSGKEIVFDVIGLETVRRKPHSITLTKKRPSRSKSIEPIPGGKRTKFFVSISSK